MTTEEWLWDRYGPTLTVDDLAQVLKKSPGTVRNYLYNGKMPIRSYREGHARMFPVKAVADYLDKRGEAAK